MSVEVLPSARLRSARHNLEALVKRAREEVAAFGPDLPFDAPAWNVSAVQKVRASSAHQTATLMFTEHAGSRVGLDDRVPLKEPFASFLKALVRLREEARHVAAQVHGVTIRAGRYLHDAAVDIGHDPCALMPFHFDQAAKACRKREEPSSRYRLGQALERIARSVDSYNVAAVRIEFQNPFPRTTDNTTRIGEEADARRTEKLPSEAALNGLARIASLVEKPRDVVGARALQLLVCGGWRINELLTLPFDCEIHDPVFENGEPLLDRNGQQVERYGIRYFPEKGAEPNTKWIPTVMVDVAKAAVSELRRVTAPARVVAAWMEEHPGRAWMPEPWLDAHDSVFMTSAEVMEVLSVSSPSAAQATAKRLGAPGMMNAKSRWGVTKGEFAAALLANQPKRDMTNLPMQSSGYLFLMQEHWNRSQTTPIEPILAHVTDGEIYDFVVTQPGKTTLFERFGCTEPGGSPVRVTTHQFRHWLNTLAQQGGMSQMEIARWSGRKDIGQNAAYDHVSPVYLAEEARRMLEGGKVHGTVAAVYERLPPVSRREFARTHFATAHTTEIGMCANDWSFAPCMEHGACAGCTMHLVRKGDVGQKERAFEMLVQHEALLAQAEAEAQEETYGASNFVAHHRRTADALRRIMAVHDDADIRDGDLVQLNLEDGGRVLALLDTDGRRAP